MALPDDVASVSLLLAAAGIADGPSMACIASSEAGLPSVARDLCGDSYTDGQLQALSFLWTSAQGRGSAWAFAQASRFAITAAFDGVPVDMLASRSLEGTSLPPALLPLSSLPERATASANRARVTQAVLAACKRTANASGASSSEVPALKTPKLSEGGPAASAPSLSMATVIAASWSKVLAKCRVLLQEFGDSSPSYCELYGRGQPSLAHQAVQDDVFRDKSAAPDTVAGHVRAVGDLRRWCGCLSLKIIELHVLDVAAFLKDQSPRGKSVPQRVFRGLCWAERAFGFSLHTGSAQVRSQSSIVIFEEGVLADSVSAEMATLKMVADMEDLVTAAPSLPLRVYAGACCCLAHGVLRWQDLQRSSSLHLTKDALVAVSMMKRKRRPTPWAALRKGFLGTDWAGSWVDALSEAGLPGRDFVLTAASYDMQTFTRRIARYNDGVGLMRALLILSGMEADVSLRFTLHSWRHLMPTMARQLRPPEHEQVEIGHWSTGSGMPRRYDSAACVTELGAKLSISSAVSGGWAPVAAGCVATDAPAPILPVLPRAKGNFAKARARKHELKETSRITKSDVEILDAGVQVVNFSTGKVHLWRMGHSSICSLYKCGTPDSAATSASFCKPGLKVEDTVSTPFCRQCYSERLAFLRLPSIVEVSSDAPPSSASESSSGSANSD
jgi:hypothetical protein